MDAQTADLTPIRFSTLGVRERDRIPFFRDFIGPAVCHLEIEPSDGPFHADMTVRRMHGAYRDGGGSGQPSAAPDPGPDGCFAALVTLFRLPAAGVAPGHA